MAEYRLKKCPFCGSNAGISELKQGPWPRFGVVCFDSRCMASVGSYFGRRYMTRKDAADAWNRRVNDG